MKLQGFLLIIFIICLTTIISYCTGHDKMMKKKKSTFTIKSGATIMSSSNTTDVYSKSQSACASMCLLHDTCCVASFSEESSICRLYTADNCCAATDNAKGWSVLTRNQYISATCAGCISFGNSMFSIIEDLTEWEKAKDICKCRGGRLVEMETSEENEFIKNEVRTLDTGVRGYWIGGYNVNNDSDFEWLSKPNQPMPITDWNMQTYPQPDNLLTQHCVMIWRSFDFRWGDHWCDELLSYICEFQHQYT